ncbi:hypothetical protein L873DRAFT_1693815 [Choiromyces venosus 120613-1]|uniref:Uncharacterized protein n=1 Tax=Choiromyces venosus 120613-1 TaxID=1336337 RepID=A0A3N4JI53_9PEZI|nr:hypothetical protein L873DRAFT_1693815 [Choiromyces venosus 120613-1]
MQKSIISAFLFLTIAQAKVSFNSTLKDFDYDGIIPVAGLSQSCAEAYAAQVSCTDHLFMLRDSKRGSKLFRTDDLTNFCTDTCVDSLNMWDTNLQGSCNDKDKEFVDSLKSGVYLGMALEDKHSVQENLYWSFCLKDEKSGKKNDFCLAKSGNLPAWPSNTPNNASDTALISNFCQSSCRTQESYLMHRSAEHLGFSSIDLANAEKICPGLDVSTFPISIKMLDAFGSSADPSPGQVDPSKPIDKKAGQIEGTEYNWDFYKSNYGTESRNAASSLGASSAFGFFVGVAAVIAMSL